MKRFVVFLGVFGAVAIGIASWLIISETNDRPASSGGDSYRAMESRLARVEKQLDELVNLAEHLSERGANSWNTATLDLARHGEAGDKAMTSAPNQSVRASATATEPEPIQEEHGQDEAMRVAQLEEAMIRDDLDARSGQAAEMAIQEALASGEWPDSELAGTECRVTLCRFVVTHKSLETARDFAMKFPLRLGWTSDSEMRISAEDPTTGAVEVTVFLARDGLRLPQAGG